MTPLYVRASAAPRIQLCPPSAIAPAVRIDSAGPEARLGSAVHEMFAAHVDGRDLDLAEVAARWECDPDEVGRLAAMSRALWSRLAPSFPDAITEAEFEPLTVGRVTFTGHADLMSLSEDGKAIGLLDLKTGWGDGDHEAQLKVYAMLAIHEMPLAETVRATVLKLRHGDMETWEWTRQDLVEWADEFAVKISLGVEALTFRPSVDACGYCPRAHECPARTQMVRSAISILAEPASRENPLDTAKLEPAGLADLLQFSRLVAKWADQATGLVKAEVQLAGGSIKVGDGRELKITTTVMTSIDYAAGKEVLRARLGDALDQCLKVSKSEAVKAVRAAAGRGEKQRIEDQLMHELDQVAALKLTASPRLEITKAAKAIEATQ